MRVLLSLFVCLSAMLMLLQSASAAGREAVRINVASSSLSLLTDAQGRTVVTAREGKNTGFLPGQPALPSRHLRVAVPHDAVAVQVVVFPVEQKVVPGFFDMAATGPVGIIGEGELRWREEGRTIVDGKDLGVYGSDDLFPGSWGEMTGGLQRLGRHRYVEVALYPVRYSPGLGELVSATDLAVEVSFDRNPVRSRDQYDNCRHEDLARRMLVNFDESLQWQGACPMPPPVDTWDNIVIVTTEDIESNSQLLDDYVLMREGQGREVTVITEADWDVSTGVTNDDRSDRIRKWLKDHQPVLELAWVLLIGNPDPDGGVINSIPMKYCAEYDGTFAPTDYFYSNLSSDWDGNGDGTFCGPSDNISFTPDTYVGRLPVYSDGVSAVDEMLESIIAYEEETLNGDISWRRRMMLPNSIYFYKKQYGQTFTTRWDGATVGEWFIRDELVPRGMEWTSLYEKEGIAPSQFESHFSVSAMEVVDQWVRGYGMVFWTGHGSDTGVYRSIWDNDDYDDNGYPDYQELESPNFMESAYTFMLDEAPPAFVIHGSCSNGHPETASNLGYSLLRRGAIGTVSASRSALTWHFPNFSPEMWEKPTQWDGDVVDIVTEYSHNLLDGMEGGRALEEAIVATLNSQGTTSWYQKTIQNFYGDPLMKLVMCRGDDDCDNGIFCDGEELCAEGSCMPGKPVICDVTEWCDEWTCDQEQDICVPAQECPDPPVDAGGNDTDSDSDGNDTDEITTEVTGAGSSCAMAPPGPGPLSLLAIIAAAAK